METLERVKLNETYKKEIIQDLNIYLSSVQQAYMNTRGYHWNIVGKHFLMLHEKYEEIYDGLNDLADEIAERIIQLEGRPLHSFSKYLETSKVKEKTDLSSDEGTIRALVEDLETLVGVERAINDKSDKNLDEATAAMTSDSLRRHEKTIWMLSALLK